MPNTPTPTRQPTPNQTKLSAFVAVCIAQAPEQSDPVAFLGRQAAHVEGYLRKLSDWAAQGPAYRLRNPLDRNLVGLNAFDLSDALDQLNAAAVRAERVAA